MPPQSGRTTEELLAELADQISRLIAIKQCLLQQLEERQRRRAGRGL